MKRTVESRCEQFALYILQNNATIRQTASAFEISKSTVHNDLSKFLPETNYEMYCDVKKILDKNFEEKHLRGGWATKQMYLEKNKA